MEELLLHALAELIARLLIAGLLDVIPQLQHGQKVRGLVLKARVRLIGLRLVLQRAFAHVLDGHGGNNDDDIVEAAVGMGLDKHARHAWIEWDAGQVAAGFGQRGLLVLILERPELVEEVEAITNGLELGWLEEGELLDIAELERDHLQNDAGQVGTQDFRVSKFRTALKVLLAIEADGDAIGDAAAPTGALVSRGLRNRLDGQALHLGPRGIARDARSAGIHDVADPGYGQRGFGDIGGQNDAPPAVIAKYAVLFLVG